MSDPAEAINGTSVGTDCISCGEGNPMNECPKSKRLCGHHCNHVWSHDHCDWCGLELGPEGAGA